MKNVEQMIIGNVNGHSLTFKKFIKDIADSKTKYEESLVMQTEIENLKKEIKTPYATPAVQHERLVKLIYIHMLGYDASFGVIDAIKFAQQSSLFYKRVGYLVSSLLLNPGREESLLLCASLQKDLNSESVVEQSMALTAICQLMGKDTISAFLPTIIRKLSHPKEIIRKKAVDVMYQFLCEVPEQSHDERYQKALCDPDAGVMISTLPIYLKLTKDDPGRYRHVSKAFTDILIQIVEGRLHNSFNYHTFPAPWAQVYLLQILQQLGQQHSQVTEEINHTLHLVVARASGKMTTPQASDAAVAVLFQVCTTILSVYPNQDLIQLVTRKIDEFLSGNCSKIYLGLSLLEKLCEKQPNIGTKFIPQVYQYTRHGCEVLQEAAIRALKVGTSSTTLQETSDLLLDLLSENSLTAALEELCCAVLADLGKRLAPSPTWYVGLLIKILSIRATTTATEPSRLLNTLINYCMRTPDPEVGQLLKNSVSADAVSQTSWLGLWCLGRYDADWDRAGLWVTRIEQLSEGQVKWLLDSLTTLVTRLGPLPPPLLSSIQPLTCNPHPIIRQMATELVNLSGLENVTSHFTENSNPILEMLESLPELQPEDLHQNPVHRQLLAKFRKRGAERGSPTIELDHETQVEGPKQRVQVSREGGGPQPAATWVSYHEHIPEETTANEKPEPPLPQPALSAAKTWGHPTPPNLVAAESGRC